MNLAMAVGAAPVEETALVFQITEGNQVGRVTLVTEPRHAHFKQAVIDGTVGFMAIGTIVRNRGMLKKVGPPSLRMTGVTVFVDACLLEHSRIRRSVRVVTVRAGNLSFPLRHMGRAHELRLSLQVALVADFRLGLPVEENGLVADLGKLTLVARLFHYSMAVDASDSAARVRASLPIGLDSSLMALETAIVLRFG